MKFGRSIAIGVTAALASMLFVSAPTSQAAATLRVGVAYDTGGPGDHSFDDAVAQGLALAKKSFSIVVSATVTVGTDSDRELRLRSLVAKNLNPIIAVGSAYASALKTVALAYPSTQFVIINDATISMLNVTSIVFSENQGGYLAGVAAALATRTGKIGLVGTQVSQYESGFTLGARDVKKDVTVLSRYGPGSLADMSSTLINAGVDVIFLTAPGSDSDVLSTVVNANSNGSKVGVILIEPDQYVTLTTSSKKLILASLVKRVDRAIVNVISEASAGRTLLDVLNARSGIYGRRYGIQNGGIELSLWSPRMAKYRKVINSLAPKAAKLPL